MRLALAFTLAAVTKLLSKGSNTIASIDILINSSINVKPILLCFDFGFNVLPPSFIHNSFYNVVYPN